MRNSYIVATATNLTALGFCILYSALSLSSNIVFTSFRDVFMRNFEIPFNKILVNVILLFVTILQIPFKFFLQKEFLFIMYDELKNRNVSTKITEMQKRFTSQ